MPETSVVTVVVTVVVADDDRVEDTVVVRVVVAVLVPDVVWVVVGVVTPHCGTLPDRYPSTAALINVTVFSQLLLLSAMYPSILHVSEICVRL